MNPNLHQHIGSVEFDSRVCYLVTKGLFLLIRCDAMRCDFSIELVILCVTVSIHAILRPTSCDVGKRSLLERKLCESHATEREFRVHTTVCKQGSPGYEYTLTCMFSTRWRNSIS